MLASRRGLRRALPSACYLHHAFRHGQALMAALLAAGLVLAATLAIWSAAGWGRPSFGMSKVSHTEMPGADRRPVPRAAAAGPARVPAPSPNSKA